MYCVRNVTSDLYWVGANDHRLALFENCFPISRAVAADQTVDLSLFKGEGRAPQHLLVTEPLLQVLDYQLRGHQSTMPVRSRGLPSRHRRSRP